MSRINWSRPKKFRPGEFEEKYEPGKELANGRVVAERPLDSLAARAQAAEKEWLAERALKAKRARAHRRAIKRIPKRDRVLWE